MARVPYVKREELDSEGQEIYDRIRRDRNAPEVGLQFRALLHSPDAASYLTSLGAELRFRSSLPADLMELAIIAIAREWNSDIEWTAHAALAAKAGVSAASIEAIRTGQGLDVLTPEEREKALECAATAVVALAPARERFINTLTGQPVALSD